MFSGFSFDKKGNVKIVILYDELFGVLNAKVEEILKQKIIQVTTIYTI